MKEKLLFWLQTNFSEVRLQKMIQEEIPNWLEDDWENEHEDEYESYQEYNNREAESAVRMTIEGQARYHFGFTDELYKKESKEELFDTIITYADSIGVDLNS